MGRRFCVSKKWRSHFFERGSLCSAPQLRACGRKPPAEGFFDSLKRRRFNSEGKNYWNSAWRLEKFTKPAPETIEIVCGLPVWDITALYSGVLRKIYGFFKKI